MTFEKQKPIERTIAIVRNYPTLDEIIEEYLRKHPEEIDSFVSSLSDPAIIPEADKTNSF